MNTELQIIRTELELDPEEPIESLSSIHLSNLDKSYRLSENEEEMKVD
jgi:hypothetical protein